MGHQPRRRRARGAGILLGVLVLVAVWVGRTAPTVAPLTQRSARAAVTRAVHDGLLEPRAAPVYAALNEVRARQGVVRLDLDATLVASAVRDACAIARGELALSGDDVRTTEAGAHHENTGLVIDDDPTTAARAMHEWWTHHRTHRRNRMDPGMTRYGVGACNAEDRTYYVERFAP
ncbi:MAG: CAP domain-containing protein [Actinobacteria bacterium]|nr:CAP domain-containing protein [Actinomycetota bacterium]